MHGVTMKFIHKCRSAAQNRTGPWVIIGKCCRKIKAQRRDSINSAWTHHNLRPSKP